MIYDCFSFFNELDILEIRLNVLKDVADKFVLVEAVKRHSGESKELFFEKNKNRYKEFLDKIIHIVVDDDPALPKNCPKLLAAWAYENHQRNAISRGLINAKPDDIIIISDLDEVPNPEMIKAFALQLDNRVMAFKQDMFCYFLNYKCVTCYGWQKAKMLRYSTFLNPETYSKMQKHIQMPEFANIGPTATRVRFLKPDMLIRNGGWHFGYYGGLEMVRLKISSIADNVCDKQACATDCETIKSRIEKGRDPYGRTGRMYTVPLDESFPQYIRDNKEKFTDGILPCNGVKLSTRIMCFYVRYRNIMINHVAKCIPNWMKPLVYAIYKRVVRNPVPLMKEQLKET